MKIVSVVGARPQFIKSATVSRAIVENNQQDTQDYIHEVIIHTGQHYDDNMSGIFFDELGISAPAYNLGVGSGLHGKQTGQMLRKIEEILIDENPDWVLVYGDTNSTLAGALAAVKLHIPVAHVESGLRSFNRKMPEEINRILTDHISEILFCPNETAVKNLANEGNTNGVYQVGDVNFDSILFFSAKTEAIQNSLFKKLSIRPKSFYLASVHRAENTDDKSRLTNILQALDEIGSSDFSVILPLHPRTAGYIKKYRLSNFQGIKFVPPVSYLEMIALEKNSKTILTDSGGIQKEAFWLKVPCVTLRDETEWIETVELGWNILAGADKQRIVNVINNPQKRVSNADWIYGDGNAAKNIVKTLKKTKKYNQKKNINCESRSIIP